MKRRLAVLTASRAEQGKLAPLMRAAAAEADIDVIATGLHLDVTRGYTVHEVERDAAEIGAQVWRFPNHASAGDMALQASTTAQGLASLLPAIRPDALLIHGDRPEALAGATVATYAGLLCMHVEGGEVSGTADEGVRHAVTKLSHVHLVANDEASDRLLAMGESPGRIHVIGSPEVDVMLGELPSLREVADRYDTPFGGDYAIVVWHPVTTLPHEEIRRQTRELIDAIGQSLGWQWVVLAPNADRGAEVIVDEYARHLSDMPGVKLLTSMRHTYYLSALRHATCIIGNSSSGVREAPVYGTPAIDLGTRQQGRAWCRTVRHVEPRSEAILDALTWARLVPRVETAQFGDGLTADRFAALLRGEAVWRTPLQKRWMGTEVAA